ESAETRMFLSMAKRQDPIRMTAAIRILGFMAGLLSQLYQRNGKLGIGGDEESGRRGDRESGGWAIYLRSSILNHLRVACPPRPVFPSPPRPLPPRLPTLN